MEYGRIYHVAKNYFRSDGIVKMAVAAILDFFKFRNVKGRKGQEGQYASPCQISWRSVKPLLRYIHVPKVGVLSEKGELGPHLTHCPLGQGLVTYQVVS